MFLTSRYLTSFYMAACLAIGAGCGDAKPAAESSTEEATVKGTVTVLGKPATQGQVIFNPTNINRPDAQIRTAEIGPGGAYRVATLVGSNSITVIVPQPAGPTESMTEEYGLDVRPGENTFDMIVPKAVQ